MKIPGRPVRFAVVCEGGNCRSVALAFVLKHFHQQDAVALGWRFASRHTLDLLCLWADYVVVMQEQFGEKISPEFRHKLRTVDVGPDRWGNPFADDLQKFLQQVAAGWRDRNFEI